MKRVVSIALILCLILTPLVSVQAEEIDISKVGVVEQEEQVENQSVTDVKDAEQPIEEVEQSVNEKTIDIVEQQEVITEIEETITDIEDIEVVEVVDIPEITEELGEQVDEESSDTTGVINEETVQDSEETSETTEKTVNEDTINEEVELPVDVENPDTIESSENIDETDQQEGVLDTPIQGEEETDTTEEMAEEKADDIIANEAKPEELLLPQTQEVLPEVQLPPTPVIIPPPIPEISMPSKISVSEDGKFYLSVENKTEVAVRIIEIIIIEQNDWKFVRYNDNIRKKKVNLKEFGLSVDDLELAETITKIESDFDGLIEPYSIKELVVDLKTPPRDNAINETIFTIKINVDLAEKYIQTVTPETVELVLEIEKSILQEGIIGNEESVVKEVLQEGAINEDAVEEFPAENVEEIIDEKVGESKEETVVDSVNESIENEVIQDISVIDTEEKVIEHPNEEVINRVIEETVEKEVIPVVEEDIEPEQEISLEEAPVIEEDKAVEQQEGIQESIEL